MNTQNLSTREQLIDRIDQTGDRLTLTGLLALALVAAMTILGLATAATGTLTALTGPTLSIAAHLAPGAAVVLALAIGLELLALAIAPREPAAPTHQHTGEEELPTWEFPVRRAA